MKNPDEAIDRVLKGLREAETPRGMELRILDATQRDPSEPRKYSPLTPIGARTWTIAAAAVIVVASVIYWTAFRDHRVVHEYIAVKQHIAPAIVPPSELQTKAQSAVQSPERSIPRLRETTKVPAAIREKGPIAPDEMVVENHPAPEAPLTEEERLLLRFAHRADPQQLEAFSPMLRSARDAEEKAEFQRFFEPPATTTNNE
jgi:hypothetical protein